MSLINKIEDLQRRPEYIRRRVMFVAIAFFMFIIISVWVSTLNLSLQQDEKTQGASAPFEIFGGMVKDVYKSASEAVGTGIDKIKELK